MHLLFFLSYSDIFIHGQWYIQINGQLSLEFPQQDISIYQSAVVYAAHRKLLVKSKSKVNDHLSVDEFMWREQFGRTAKEAYDSTIKVNTLRTTVAIVTEV